MNRIEHRENEWEFPFVEYSCGDESKKRALIVQLHGAGERGDGKDDLDLVEVHGFSKILPDDIAHECVVVMPQCPKNSFWAAKVESLVKFVEHLIAEYNIDERQVYLTGLSMGGYGTWFTAMARPDLFAAIAPVCGGGMAWNAGVLDMPVWAFHGSDDVTVSPVQSDEMVAALKAANADVTYTRLDGVGHDVWEHTYDETLLDWFLSKKR